MHCVPLMQYENGTVQHGKKNITLFQKKGSSMVL